MKRTLQRLSPIICLVLSLTGCATPIEQAVHSAGRTPANMERDRFRHPAETLSFLGIEPNMVVVEVWPGAGWYTEILAPLLRNKGQLYAAHFGHDSGVPFFERALAAFQDKLAASPDVYDKVILTHLQPPDQVDIAPAGSVDALLTFRNVHNWAKAGSADSAFEAFYRALKPGGILGVVEHRAPPGRPFEQQIESGYMTQDWVIDAAQRAGFQLVATSEVNANSRDSADHPAGVWSLPPTLRLGDEGREHYISIGESDRMTLKFIKPAEAK